MTRHRVKKWLTRQYRRTHPFSLSFLLFFSVTEGLTSASQKLTFASSITLSQVNAGTINTVVEVRIKAGIVTGTVSGFIQNSIDGIVRTVSVSGFVSTATLTVTTNTPDNQLSVTAFPNPFADYITIALKGAAGKPVSVRLTTDEGRLVLQKEIIATGALQQMSIEVPKDIKGVCHLEANINGSKHIIKMIRQ